ncbi:LysR family transcriptional regulator [Nonomuraea sp. NPDC050691]|uniref:LysR family transcriptional regulator n=1 Tax=Nonomuraea sp. NPDC050691 TaxID=3155661 RepID=UPI00340B2CC6
MELRDIEIFLTLAQELHFGRTAERLHVTPARVSQAIKKQERRIGATLFERSNRHVALTPIGKQLFEDLSPAYRGLHEGFARAVAAARGDAEVLRLGMIGQNIEDYRLILEEFARRRPGCAVRFRHVDFSDPFGPLRAGEVDIQIPWLPVREPDLTVGPIVLTEPIVLLTGTSHRLAGRESISLEDLGDEVVMGGAQPGYWREGLVPTHTPSGRLIEIGPIVTNYSDMIPILVSGEAVSPGFAHGQRVMPVPGITYVPIHDAPPGRWVLVWRTAAENDLIRDFVRTARDLGSVDRAANG